jgi:hypothetical protein
MRLDSYPALRYRNHLTRQVNLINRAVSMVGNATGRAHDTLYFSQWDLNCSIWFRV